MCGEGVVLKTGTSSQVSNAVCEDNSLLYQLDANERTEKDKENQERYVPV